MKRRNTVWLAAVLLALPLAAQPPSPRLPNHLPPEIYAWFWQAPEFQPDGYKPFLNRIATQTNFGLLTTSLRIPEREVTLPTTHDQIRRAVEYAHSLGLRVAFDLDVRLARGEFLNRYPTQQQWMLRIRRVPAGQRSLTIESLRLGDHMTWPTGQYELLSGRLAAAFDSNSQRVDVRVVEQSASAIKVEASENTWIAAAFEYRTPDVFAPALLDFQESIYAQYRDIPLDGVLKDEWGFPPVYNRGPREGDFWYSEAFANAYRAAGGGDLVEACVRMFANNDAQAAERYSRLILARNSEVEKHFYSAVKRVWGSDAFVGTHATWGIMPTGDAFKNGYDWWSAPRDYGQTDEDWPYPIRTSLAKKWGKPVWFNQYYNSDPEAYAPELWKAVRNGGRLNFHPLYPFPKGQDYDAPLLRSPVMRAESRIRLLNYITRAPVDSPVAVIFSHSAALNWMGLHLGDLGLDVARDLERYGYRTDVIPSSEITAGALRVDQTFVRYGAQRYRAIVLLNTLNENSRHPIVPRASHKVEHRSVRARSESASRHLCGNQCRPCRGVARWFPQTLPVTTG